MYIFLIQSICLNLYICVLLFLLKGKQQRLTFSQLIYQVIQLQYQVIFHVIRGCISFMKAAVWILSSAMHRMVFWIMQGFKYLLLHRIIYHNNRINKDKRLACIVEVLKLCWIAMFHVRILLNNDQYFSQELVICIPNIFK